MTVSGRYYAPFNATPFSKFLRVISSSTRSARRNNIGIIDNSIVWWCGDFHGNDRKLWSAICKAQSYDILKCLPQLLLIIRV